MSDTEIVEGLRRRAERGEPWGAVAVYRSALDESTLAGGDPERAPGRDRRGFRYAAVLVLVAALAGGIFAGRADRDGGRVETETPGSVPPVTALDLAGHTFAGNSVTENGAPRAVVDGARPLSLRFMPADVRVSGGCNYTVGSYRIVDGALDVDVSGPPTPIGCGSALSAQDSWFGRFVASRPTIELQDHRLRLTSGSTVVVLDEKPEMVPVVGPVWVLDSVATANLEEDEVFAIPTDPVPTLQLRPDGRWTVTGLCITFHGTYELHGRGEDTQLGEYEMVDFFPTDRGYAGDRCGPADEGRRNVDRRLQAMFNTARRLFPSKVVGPRPTGNDLAVRNVGLEGDVWRFRS